MKTRAQLSAAEVTEVREGIARRLEGIGVSSQPEVALKILELSRNPKSELKDYSDLIKTDPALSGRLLKLSNSALFAQRKAVSSIDRACVLLGVERLRALALGFHLCRAAAGEKSQAISREIWGQSLFRACLSAEAAKRMAPTLVSEAFVIGLMMDAGLPLMPRLAGGAFGKLWETTRAPGKLFRLENEFLGFTHVDVIAALAKAWRLPDILSQPLEWHHTPCGEQHRPEPVHKLHRIAYACGLVDLSNRNAAAFTPPDAKTPGMSTLARLWNVPDAEFGAVISKAGAEYQAIGEMFGDVAETLRVDEELIERVRVTAVDVMDSMLLGQIESDRTEGSSRRFVLGGREVIIEGGQAGKLVAFLIDSQGNRLTSYALGTGHVTPEVIREALGLDAHEDDDIEGVGQFLNQAA